MDSIKDIIPTVFQQITDRPNAVGTALEAAWQKIAGGEGSRAMSLTAGCLTVHVDSPMRMVKLNLNKGALLLQIKREFPAIERIYLKVANT